MAKRLKNLLVTEVSLVDKGANNKRFHLMKAADKNPETEAAAVPATPEPTRVEKALASAVDGETEGLDGFGDEKDVVVAIRRLAKSVDVKAVFGLVEKAAPAPAAPVDPLAALSPEAKAQVEAVFKEASDLKKALETEREAKANTEAVAKAAVDYKNLPEKPEALGPALRALRKADGKVADLIENVLKRADAVFAQVLQPVGTAAAASASNMGGSTWETVQKRAADMVAKKEAKSVAAGVAAILDKEPELYTAIHAEKQV